MSEYEQDLGIRPGTLCAYDVEAECILDLKDFHVLRLTAVEPGGLAYAWKQIALIQKKRPPTWGLADRLMAQDIVGAGAGTTPPLARRASWRWIRSATCRSTRAHGAPHELRIALSTRPGIT